ncbi:ATP-binding protein [Streptomyces sp. ODS28]|uniref:ATP-binding protein n=1 Tax=Streptomyces sp. ODS28 TaxID=3136688 RepID=UPI0031E60883
MTTETRRFSMRFTSTPRGARLARRLVAQRLAEWGHPYGSDTHDTATLIAGELAANAVRHGHVRGRDFRLALAAQPGTVRVEVTDTRGESTPVRRDGGPDAESGRGLLLVSRLACRWAVTSAGPGAPGKTVWAEVSTPVAQA